MKAEFPDDNPYSVPEARLQEAPKKRKGFKERINDWRFWVISLILYALISRGWNYFDFMFTLPHFP